MKTSESKSEICDNKVSSKIRSKIWSVGNMMGKRQEWFCRVESNTKAKAKSKSILGNDVANTSYDSSFSLTFWEEGTVSGVRVKSMPDTVMGRKGWKSWGMLDRPVLEEAGVWDVAGQWDNQNVILQLLPRRDGSSPLLLRGEWALNRVGLITSVQLEFNSGRMKQGLELVREDMMMEEKAGFGQMQVVRESLRQLHHFFGSSKLEGFDDLTVVTEDGQFEIKTSRLVFLSQSDYFKALLRQES